MLTDDSDRTATHCDLTIDLTAETCDWLTEPAVQWFRETVNRAVMVEFDRYIEAGDLAKTMQRLAELQAKTDESGGFMGMYL